jgi:hypothetical protein
MGSRLIHLSIAVDFREIDGLAENALRPNHRLSHGRSIPVPRGVKVDCGEGACGDKRYKARAVQNSHDLITFAEMGSGVGTESESADIISRLPLFIWCN